MSNKNLVPGVFCSSTNCDFLNQVKEMDWDKHLFCEACSYPLSIKRPRVFRFEGVANGKPVVMEKFTELEDKKKKAESAGEPEEGELVTPKDKKTNAVLAKELDEVTPIAHSTLLGDKRTSLNLRARAEQLDLDSVRRKLCLDDVEDPADYYYYYKFKEEDDDDESKPGNKVKKIYKDLEQEETRTEFPTAITTAQCIRELAARLVDLDEDMQLKANRICIKALEAKVLEGYSDNAQAAACMEVACASEAYHLVTYKDICDASFAYKEDIDKCKNLIHDHFRSRT
jgi:hypothetical protein